MQEQQTPQAQVIRIVLPFASPSQNVWQAMHWAQRHKQVAEYRMLVRAQLRLQGIVLPPRENLPPRTLRFTRHGLRALDHGNLVGGAKGIVDALVAEGVLRDDAPRWLNDSYTQTAPAAQRKTVIEVCDWDGQTTL